MKTIGISEQKDKWFSHDKLKVRITFPVIFKILPDKSGATTWLLQNVFICRNNYENDSLLSFILNS